MIAALLGFAVLSGVLGSAWAYTVTGSVLLAFVAYTGTGVCVLVAAMVSSFIFPNAEPVLAEDPLLLLNDWQT